ncbi:putative diphthamide synthesis protein-domain-containing protein [Lipomyces arxii]|uniref:putative diphthamide synthesis protein-domain-containing protein n=1 Tax=Lipomyces arxii TaxID=56418 RepID=UPI0034CF5A87
MADTSVAPVLSSQPTYFRVSAQKETFVRKADLSAQYHLDELARYITELEYKRVALQFPDSLLLHSTVVVSALNDELLNLGTGNVMVFVLGDTSYSECCVDEIAAQHVSADVVVHVGVACLNPVVSSPVVYLFGEEHLDLDKCVEVFKNQIPDSNTHVLIVAETTLQTHVEPLRQRLSEYTNILTTLPILSGEATAQEHIIPPLSPQPTFRVRSEIPRRCHEPLQTDLSSYTLFHLGIPPAPSHLHLATLFKTPPIIIDPATSSPVSASATPLARRYKTMLSARAASTIGILVNTLSLKSSAKLISSLETQIKAAGKKHYVIAVGKPNVAKLANFDVVDAWVVVGCDRGGVIIDTAGEYYKPLVTPFELSLALKRDISWGGQWILQFENVLKLDDDDLKKDGDNDQESGNEGDDLPPQFDAVSGRYVASRPLQSRSAHVDIAIEESGPLPKSQQLIGVKNAAGQLATRGSEHYSTAGAFLQSRRFWKGLGSDFIDQDDDDSEDDTSKKTEFSVVEEGRSGIARGYDNPE